MNRLVDVDVSGLHLVGAPANRRPFALVKNRSGRKPEEPETMKLTRAEFLKRISTEVEGDIEDAKLESLAKAIGIELVEKDETPAPKAKVKKTTRQDPDETEDEAAEPGALAKGLEAVIEKATKPLLDQIAALQKHNDEAAKVALQKRAKVLKSAGYEIEDSITEAEVSALEKGHAMVVKAAERVGLTKAFGSAEADEPTGGAPALRRMVTKQVEAILGRAPTSKLENARVKQEIYRANPGLLTAIVKAERDARARVA